MNGELVVALAQQVHDDPKFHDAFYQWDTQNLPDEEENRLFEIHDGVLLEYIQRLGDGIELLEHAKQAHDLLNKNGIEYCESAVDALRQFVELALGHEIRIICRGHRA